MTLEVFSITVFEFRHIKTINILNALKKGMEENTKAIRKNETIESLYGRYPFLNPEGKTY